MGDLKNKWQSNDVILRCWLKQCASYEFKAEILVHDLIYMNRNDKIFFFSKRNINLSFQTIKLIKSCI